MSLPCLRVAFDMDGTVADMHAVLARESARLFGPVRAEPVAPPDTAGDIPSVVAHDDLQLDRSQLRLLWQHVEATDNFWTTLPEMEPGIVARIAASARARAWEVLFITTRPPTAGDPVQWQTQRWLRTHGFDCPSVCVLQRSRGRLADVLQLDAVVDDRPENCVDVATDSKAAPLLVWPASRQPQPSGLDRAGVRLVGSIGEAIDWLENFDDSRRGNRVIRSVRKLFRRQPQ